MSTAAVIEVSNLTVRLGAFTALEGVSFSVQPGETVAVLGPNGAGKTTLIHALLGLVQPAAGSVEILGHPPLEAPAEQIGYVPQLKTVDRGFPALTCELVASGHRRSWPGRLSRAEHRETTHALSLVGAANLCHKPLRWLSGGELQRVYLARALIRQPKLLLLDEPATGIDLVGEDDMYTHLEQYQRESGCAVLMVTHDWLAAQHHATKALLLNRKLMGFGPPAEALSDENMRQAFGHTGHVHPQNREGRDD
jgi:zinc transport system ATP-binding protein